MSDPTAREAAVDRLLARGVAEVIVREELRARLLGTRPLRVKFGVDPTRPDLHLGHYVVFRKLREFQALGHEIVIIIGDWTAQIGDPSGRSATRQMLTADEVRANAQTYLDQLFKVIDAERTEINWQSAWFGTFTLADVIDLTSRYTVARMLARDDFAKRYAEGAPIAVTEFLYPLLQGYDSVAVRADVELGGTDQTFNLLVGRDIQREVGQQPQDILTLPLLVGTDGAQKMSKSLGNYIGVTEPADSMFGKLMSIPDSAMPDYYRLLTGLPADEIETLLATVGAGTLNPREAKERLATLIVTDLHSSHEAEQARDEFNRVHKHHELPREMPEIAVPRQVRLIPLLVQAGLAEKNNEARRYVTQGGVRIDGERIEDPNAEIVLTGPTVLQVGPRRFVRLMPE
ncbi:MAG TPA: tyrosine--tRNA ligase [Thermomicrobiaceae bacterium]|nr:tyrosine--tRNA ligase [Thermomicrobiaceae bacterium]